jgi:isopenicillin-N N-acyltransferase-like protein
VTRDICWRIVKQVYLPSLRRLWPSGLQELMGMSAGANLRVEKLIMLNARDDLATINHLLQDTSSQRSAVLGEAEAMDETFSVSFARATQEDEVIAVQSWNSSRPLHDKNLIVYLEIHHEPSEALPVIFTVTEAGLLAGSGMNSSGISLTSNRLFSSADFVPEPGGSYLPSMCQQRILLACSSTKMAYPLCQILARHCSRHFLISDRHGPPVSLEIAPKNIFLHRDGFDRSVLLHTNHFQSFEAFLARQKVADRYQGRSSYWNLSRLRSLLGQRKGQKFTMPDVVRIFSDHADSLGTICQHTTSHKTTALFVIYNLTRRMISICKGPPQENRMIHFTFDDDGHGLLGLPLPGILEEGPPSRKHRRTSSAGSSVSTASPVSSVSSAPPLDEGIGIVDSADEED